VLSELDARRRADFLDAVSDLDQVLLTITDATSLPETVQSRAYVYSVEGGLVTLEASPASADSADSAGTSGHESVAP